MTLKRIVDHANAYLKRPLDVELFTNNTFMGLFVTENDANFLKRIALQYVKEVSPSSKHLIKLNKALYFKSTFAKRIL